MSIFLPPKVKASPSITTVMKRIYGIGHTQIAIISSKIGLNRFTSKRISQLSDTQYELLAMNINNMQKQGLISHQLRQKTDANIQKNIDMNSWRGLRHTQGLPVRGQRTQTNASTSKGRTKFLDPKIMQLRKSGKPGYKSNKEKLAMRIHAVRSSK